MKKGMILLLLLCLAFFPCLTAAADLGTPLQELPEEEAAKLDALLNKYIFCDFYTPDSMKQIKSDRFSVSGVSAGNTDTVELYLCGEPVTSGYIKFMSGDKHLKEAVFFERDLKTKIRFAGVRTFHLLETGEAVFHVKLKSEHYQFAKDYTLKVIPFPEDGFIPNDNKEITICPGYTYTAENLVGMLGSLSPELAGSITSFEFQNPTYLWWTSELMTNYYQSAPRMDVIGDLSLTCANAVISFNGVKVKQGEGYLVTGPDVVCPGTKVIYNVRYIKGKNGKPADTVLAAQGAEIDSRGVLSVSPEAKPGDEIFLTVSSEETGKTASMQITVAESAWEEPSWTEVQVLGLSIPVPYGGGTVDVPEPKQMDYAIKSGEESYYDNIEFQVGKLKFLVHYDITRIPPAQISNYSGNAKSNAAEWAADEEYPFMDLGYFRINNSPAAYVTRNSYFYDDVIGWCARMVAVAGGYRLEISYDVIGKIEDGVPPVTKEFLLDALSRMKIDGVPVEISE